LCPTPHFCSSFCTSCWKRWGKSNCSRTLWSPGRLPWPPRPQRAALPLRPARTGLAHLHPWSIDPRPVPGPGGLRPEDPGEAIPKLPARLVAGLAGTQPSPAWPRRGWREPESPAGRGRASAGRGCGRPLPPRCFAAPRRRQQSLAEGAGMGAGVLGCSE